jgi:hypothetical protein
MNNVIVVIDKFYLITAKRPKSMSFPKELLRSPLSIREVPQTPPRPPVPISSIEELAEVNILIK